MHKNTINLVGQRFGKLLVTSQAGSVRYAKSTVVLWNTLCDCGNHKTVTSTHLKDGHTKSCGCKNPCKARHLMSRTSEYRTWQKIVSRTTAPSDPAFERYSKLGICERWRTRFDNFFEDMGLKPKDGKYSIDRIDNDKGYTCGKCEECLRNDWKLNCRWATAKQQNNNRKDNRIVNLNGRDMTLAQAADELKVPAYLISNRLHRGSTIEKALMCPKNPIIISRFINYKDEKLRLSVAAKRFGLSIQTIRGRIKLGWGIERALETPVKKRS